VELGLGVVADVGDFDFTCSADEMGVGVDSAVDGRRVIGVVRGSKGEAWDSSHCVHSRETVSLLLVGGP